MKQRLLTLLVLTFAVGTGYAQQRATFEALRNNLEKVYTRTQPDGTVKVSKQLRRWEWFWESRLLPDGTLPPSSLYLDAVKFLKAEKQQPSLQSAATWKEVGPFAPDLPGRNNAWNGIGRVNCIAFHPVSDAMMWIGAAQGGLWKTTDGGTSWKVVSLGDFPQTGVSDVAVAQSNPQVLYLATGDVDATFPGELSSFPGFTYGVLKSVDGGATWAQTGLAYSPDQNVLVGRLWVDPANADVVVAATYDGMKMSTDGGTTWATSNSNLAFRDVVGLPNSSKVLIATTYNNRGGAAIYRSEDAGGTWGLVMQATAANRIRLAVSNSSPNVVGAIASDARTNGLDDVYYSNNGGKTFAPRNININLLGWSSTGNDAQQGGQGFYDLAMAIDPTNDKNWIVGGVNAWRSTNTGASWVLSSHWTGQGAPWVHADHHFQAYHPRQNKLYDCSDGGIARSTDRGVTWRDISTSLSIQQYYGLSVTEMNSEITLAGAQDNGTALTVDGSGFQHVLSGDGMATAIDYFNPNVMYGSQPYGVFYRSTNGGGGWKQISSPGARGESNGSWVSPIAADPNKQNTLYVGYTQVYKSTDAGTSWARLGTLDGTGYLRKLAVAPSNSNYLFAAFTSSAYRSTNGGTTWSPISGVSGYVQEFEIDPDDPQHFWICFGGFNSSAKVFEFTNGKLTNVTGVGLPNVPVNAIEYQGGPLGRLFIGTDVGVFFQDAGSNVWEQYGNGLAETVVSGMEIIEIADKLRISTYGRGIWEVDVSQCVAASPKISASGLTSFCAGDSVLLTASDGYDSYRWSDGTEGKTLLIKNVPQSGSYSVSVEDAKGCRATSATIDVTVIRAPGKPFVALRGTDTLRATALGGTVQYQWFLEGTAIPGATERTYVASISGEYTVKVTNDDGCTAISNPFAFVGTAVTDDDPQATLAIWPNPVTGLLHLRLPQGYDVQVDVIDLTGSTVYSEQVIAGKDEHQIEMNELGIANGAYLIRVTGAHSMWSTVVIKR